MRASVILLLLPLIFAASPQQPKAPAVLTFAQMTLAQIDSFLAELAVAEPDYTRRLIKVSERFVGVPYQLSPLGEGPGNKPDEDPLMRFDRVDCTTFVEEVIALARATNLAEAEQILTRVRYQDGRVDYLARKHFMMSQWIPQNQADGFLADITEQVAGKDTRWVTKRLDGEIWERRKNKEALPQLAPDQVPSGEFCLPIVPIDQLAKHLQKVPSGTILNVVRRDTRSVPDRVSHQGMLVEKGGRIFLRHASRLPFQRVVDEPVENFLRRNSAYGKWPVEGFNLLRVKPPSKSESSAEIREKSP